MNGGDGGTQTRSLCHDSTHISSFSDFRRKRIVAEFFARPFISASLFPNRWVAAASSPTPIETRVSWYAKYRFIPLESGSQASHVFGHSDSQGNLEELSVSWPAPRFQTAVC